LISQPKGRRDHKETKATFKETKATIDLTSKDHQDKMKEVIELTVMTEEAEIEKEEEVATTVKTDKVVDKVNGRTAEKVIVKLVEVVLIEKKDVEDTIVEKAVVVEEAEVDFRSKREKHTSSIQRLISESSILTTPSFTLL